MSLPRRSRRASIPPWNLKDYDRTELAKAGVVAQNPDIFLCCLLTDSPESAVTAFKRMRDNLRNPPKSTRECADTLAAQGLKKFAGLIATRLE